MIDRLPASLSQVLLPGVRQELDESPEFKKGFAKGLSGSLSDKVTAAWRAPDAAKQLHDLAHPAGEYLVPEVKRLFAPFEQMHQAHIGLQARFVTVRELLADRAQK